MGRVPTEEEGLRALQNKDSLENEDDAPRWKGPYLELANFKDKWNHDLVYRNPSESLGEGNYDLVSFGPDGEEGTDDDISNHDALRDETGEINTDDMTTPTDDAFGS
jgi:general secretion pathway protein G